MNPQKIASFAPGLNNRRGPTQLDTIGADRTRATYLAAAENVDINEKGRVRRRGGTTRKIAGRAHSMWSDERGAFCVLDNVLGSLSAQGTSVQFSPIRNDVMRQVSFSRGADGEVYWTDGSVIRRIAGGQDRPVVTESLEVEPSVIPVAGGLRAGQYMLVFTAIGPDGESGSTTPTYVDVPDNGGVFISGLPGRPTRIYMSGPNGEVPTLVMTTSNTQAAIMVYSGDGIRCQTLLNSPMPAGQIVRHFLGRMLVAVGNTLYISEPYNYGIFNGASGYIPFPEPITVVEPTPGGLYVVADQTYFFADLNQGPTIALSYGALAGSGGFDRRSKTAFWMSVKGIVVADMNGQARNVQEEALTFGPARRAATLYREVDGNRHILAVCTDVQPNGASSISASTRDTFRKGN